MPVATDVDTPGGLAVAGDGRLILGFGDEAPAAESWATGRRAPGSCSSTRTAAGWSRGSRGWRWRTVSPASGQDRLRVQRLRHAPGSRGARRHRRAALGEGGVGERARRRCRRPLRLRPPRRSRAPRSAASRSPGRIVTVRAARRWPRCSRSSTAWTSTTPGGCTSPPTAPARSGASIPDGRICAIARGLGSPSAVAVGGAGTAFPDLYAVTFGGDVIAIPMTAT